LIHTSHKDREQSTTEASITLDDTDWSPNIWPSVCREIPVSADKMFWTSNNPAEWTPCITIDMRAAALHVKGSRRSTIPLWKISKNVNYKNHFRMTSSCVPSVFCVDEISGLLCI
jgi:hypothetical protein